MIDCVPVALERPSLVAVWVFSPLFCSAVSGSFWQLYSGDPPRRAYVLPQISSSEALTQHPPNSALTPGKSKCRVTTVWLLKHYMALGFRHCFKVALFSLAVSKCWVYLCSLRDALFVQFKRSSNTSANLRKLLSWQERIIIWQPACQLLKNIENIINPTVHKAIWTWLKVYFFWGQILAG